MKRFQAKFASRGAEELGQEKSVMCAQVDVLAVGSTITMRCLLGDSGLVTSLRPQDPEMCSFQGRQATRTGHDSGLTSVTTIGPGSLGAWREPEDQPEDQRDPWFSCNVADPLCWHQSTWRGLCLLTP